MILMTTITTNGESAVHIHYFDQAKPRDERAAVRGYCDSGWYFFVNYREEEVFGPYKTFTEAEGARRQVFSAVRRDDCIGCE